MSSALLSIERATQGYENWLATQTSVVRADVQFKHRKMAAAPFTFLRGTSYRWLQIWPALCDPLCVAPQVFAVGDLHVENFGTWRDAEGRLIWGINDVDEACTLPYTQDLVRLATSARLALELGHLDLSFHQACQALLDGYRSSLDCGGRPIVLAEHHRWLQQIAVTELKDPAKFWTEMGALTPASGHVPRRMILAAFPRGATHVRIYRRVAGVGSLGRPRFAAIGSVGGSAVAREAKALIPSAAIWIRGRGAPRRTAVSMLERAVRVSDPFLTVRGRWVLRRLAPDCAKINIGQLPRRRDDRKLLRAMGWETANLHLASGRARNLTNDLDRRPRPWLERAAGAMSEAVV